MYNLPVLLWIDLLLFCINHNYRLTSIFLPCSYVYTYICLNVCNCFKDRLPDRHSCLNLYPCVIKVQSINLSLSLSPHSHPRPISPSPSSTPTYHRLVTEHRGVTLQYGGEGHADLQLSQSHTDTVPWSHPKRQEGERMPSRFGLWGVSGEGESLQNDAVITTIN